MKLGMMRKSLLALAAAAAGTLASGSAHASLTVFQQFNGSYGLSTDGGGSTSGSYSVSAFVPVGATVTAAYLYQSNNLTTTNQAVSLNGNALTFSSPSIHATPLLLSSSRADVTSIVAPVVNGGVSGTYNFTVSEGDTTTTDGTALVVVYSLASLPTQTVAILDGFSASGGDSTSLNFSSPIDPTAAGFVADLRLGIGYSYPPQSSNVSINGTLITSVAGGYDDGVAANGGLITVGGSDDAFTPANPTYDQDHEHYNITPYLKKGDTSINVTTNNPSGDDNIFLATFLVSGNAGVNAPPPVVTPSVPEPAQWSMMIGGIGMMGGTLRRRRRTAGDQALATA